MKIIHARNVNDAYAVGLRELITNGKRQESRDGSVLSYPGPVCTTYEKPWERVLFNKKRDANPFFHMMEGLWMLAGRNDVKWISEFNGNIHKYSDNGETFHGAYGHRWRHYFNELDQIQELIKLLIMEPNTRRAVLTMWDPVADLGHSGLDFPCNLAIAFRIRTRAVGGTRHSPEHMDRLDMTVYNRSNDIVWGAYGANIVHMSMLQEYVASMVGVGMGHYHQVSNDYHIYERVLEQVGMPQPHPNCPYEMGHTAFLPMIDNPNTWNVDLMNFMQDPTTEGLDNQFFNGTAQLMVLSWRSWKNKKHADALTLANMIMAPDWKRACSEWLKRRIENETNETGRRSTPLAHDSTAT